MILDNRIVTKPYGRALKASASQVPGRNRLVVSAVVTGVSPVSFRVQLSASQLLFPRMLNGPLAKALGAKT